MLHERLQASCRFTSGSRSTLQNSLVVMQSFFFCKTKSVACSFNDGLHFMFCRDASHFYLRGSNGLLLTVSHAWEVWEAVGGHQAKSPLDNPHPHSSSVPTTSRDVFMASRGLYTLKRLSAAPVKRSDGRRGCETKAGVLSSLLFPAHSGGRLTHQNTARLPPQGTS